MFKDFSHHLDEKIFSMWRDKKYFSSVPQVVNAFSIKVEKTNWLEINSVNSHPNSQKRL